jgi:uncharacterized sulfatase
MNAQLEGFKERHESFFLWASFFDPHPQYLVPEPWDNMYDPSEIIVQSGVTGEHAENPPHFHMTEEENPDFSSLRETGFHINGYQSHHDAYSGQFGHRIRKYVGQSVR